MLKGFKDFIMRGNVVDLAVAVVIGAAFGGVVTAFTEKIIQPIVNALPGTSPQGLGTQLKSGAPPADAAKTLIDWSALITAAINFIIVAAVIYFLVVVPLKKLAERANRGKEAAAEAPPADVALLTEIRDLLRVRA